MRNWESGSHSEEVRNKRFRAIIIFDQKGVGSFQSFTGARNIYRQQGNQKKAKKICFINLYL